MTEQEDTQRLRAAFAVLAEGAHPRADCPEGERLWDAIGGELPAAETREMVEHTASCPSCAEAWRLARELERGAREELAGESQAGVSRAETSRWAVPRGGWRWLAAAAAVLLALVGVRLWWTPPVDGPPAEFRSPTVGTIRSLLVDGAPLPRAEFRLRWEAPPHAARYEVLVTTEALEVISTARGVGTPEYQVPETQLEDLPSGARVLWQVEALLEDGGSALSPTFVNRLE
jgi:anti-sigma factor RsiW